MKKETFSIKKNCRLLVEQILNEDFLNATKLLQKLVNEAQERREKNIIKSLISEQEENNSDGFEGDDNLDGGDGAIDEEEDNTDEPTTDSPDLGETLDDEDSSDDQVGEGKLNEMTTELTNLNHSLNKAKIKKLYNKISTLKSQLNALNLDRDEMRYVELETKLSFYSEVLENLQQQSMPGIDGVEQEEMKEKIDIVYKELKNLEDEINSSNTDDDSSNTDDDSFEDDDEVDEPSDETEDNNSDDQNKVESEDETNDETNNEASDNE